MEEPDANVLYIHTPKANDTASWILQAGVFFFFCLGVIFIGFLVKIANDVGKSLDAIRESKTELIKPRHSNGLFTVYGHRPKPGDSAVDIVRARCGGNNNNPGPNGFRRTKSYYGLGNEDSPSRSYKYGLPSAFQDDDDDDNDDTPTGNRNPVNPSQLPTSYSFPNIQPDFNNFHPKVNNHLATASPFQDNYHRYQYYGSPSYGNGNAPASYLRLSKPATETETPVCFLYQGMPRRRQASSSSVASLSSRTTSSHSVTTTRTTPAKSEKSDSVYVYGQKRQNASDWSDIMERMSVGGAPFPEYYTYSRRP